MSWVQMSVTIFCTMLTSSGLWAFVASKQKVSDASTRLMLGLAHDAIVSQGVRYINRGYITFDEYEDFMKYLCEPYTTFGGNGPGREDHRPGQRTRRRVVGVRQGLKEEGTQ